MPQDDLKKKAKAKKQRKKSRKADRVGKHR